MAKERRARRTFSREYKIEAVRMISEPGMSLSGVARNLELDPKILRRWRSELEEDGAGAFPGEGNRPPEEAELFRLKSEIKRLKMERDILKKALGIFSQDPRN